MRVAYCTECNPVFIVAVGPFNPDPAASLVESAGREFKRKELLIEEERKITSKDKALIKAANETAVKKFAEARTKMEIQLARAKRAVAAKHRVKGATHIAKVIELPEDPREPGEPAAVYLDRIAKANAAKLV